MAPTNNGSTNRTVHKRDAAYSLLEFNREYPHVKSELMDRENDKLLHRQELKSKKRLLPLEIAALPPAERNELLAEREYQALVEKQKLPRRAIQQEYLRRVKKSGEQEAESYRQSENKKLDDALTALRAELEKKYPKLDSGEAPSSQAVEAYEKAEAEEQARLDALRKSLEEKKQAKLSALTARLEKQNQKYQVRFEEANAQLKSMSPISEEDFGPENILSVRNLKMYFSGIKAVDDLSFSIRQGEIFGLIGPNGAGKTTVFNCITRFYKPTDGEVYYRDRFGNIVSMSSYKAQDVIKCGISRTFQNIELVYWLSILDNLLVGVHAFFRSNLADQFIHSSKLQQEEDVFRKRAESILERLGILAYKDALPMGLPYGVLKKVELARTLMSNPRMIILDEPAAGLNDAETEDLTEVIRLIRDDFHCTIFLVEHDVDLVMNVCDTICAISFGKMLAIGTPEEIQNSPLVQEAYLGTE